MDLIVTIPLRVYYMVKDAELGMKPWINWDHTQSKYSPVFRVMAFISKNRHDTARSLEISRWWLVLNAFVFFAFFGFTSEARQNYRRAFTSLTSRIRSLMSSGTFNESSPAYAVQVFFSTL
jgi:pheromone a factor receptor